MDLDKGDNHIGVITLTQYYNTQPSRLFGNYSETNMRRFQPCWLSNLLQFIVCSIELLTANYILYILYALCNQIYFFTMCLL